MEVVGGGQSAVATNCFYKALFINLMMVPVIKAPIADLIATILTSLAVTPSKTRSCIVAKNGTGMRNLGPLDSSGLLPAILAIEPMTTADMRKRNTLISGKIDGPGSLIINSENEDDIAAIPTRMTAPLRLDRFFSMSACYPKPTTAREFV
jgi:hypothetical protein